MPGEVWGKIVVLVAVAALGVAALLWATDRGLERVVEQWPVEEPAHVRWGNCPACGQSFTGPQRTR